MLTAKRRGFVPGSEVVCLALQGLSVSPGGVLLFRLVFDFEGAFGNSDFSALLFCEEPGLCSGVPLLALFLEEGI